MRKINLNKANLAVTKTKVEAEAETKTEEGININRINNANHIIHVLVLKIIENLPMIKENKEIKKNKTPMFFKMLCICIAKIIMKSSIVKTISNQVMSIINNRSFNHKPMIF